MKKTFIYCLTASISTIAFADVIISGVVRDASNGTPLAGALITLQATSTKTVTTADGSYSLSIPEAITSTIVAANKGFFNSPIQYEGTPTGLDIYMEPVPQDDNEYYSFLEPTHCGMCHPDQLSDWINSPMNNAGVNT